MSKKETITVQGTEITIISMQEKDYICITDIAKYKSDDPAAVIANWMRNRNTVEFLGVWESLYNPNFKPLEFEGFRKEAGLNAFTLSPQKWIDATDAIGLNPEQKGNVRDYATLEQLVVLSNMESINALLIRQALPQGERLMQLNNVAITQMRSLVDNKGLKRVK